MDRNKFHSILQRYMRGEANAEEKALIDSWYLNMGKDFPPDFGEIPQAGSEDKYWTQISDHMRRKSNQSRERSMNPWYLRGIAASILVVLFSLPFVLPDRPEIQGALTDKQRDLSNDPRIVNTGLVAQLVTLPDKSRVTLQPHSQLTYSGRFTEKERVVFLEGEAFFEIVPDLSKPFLVYTKNVATKVLGTSFTVKAFQKEKNVIVEVKTGKVSVYAYEKEKPDVTKTDEIILTPNQRIVYDKEENTLSRMIVANPLAIIPADELKRMRFEAAPVKEIFAAIEKVYGVDLVYDEAGIASCTLTTSISDGDLYNRMDIICFAIGARYEVSGDQILIKDPACNNQ